MTRMQISPSREQMDALRHEASRRGISIAALVRSAVDAEPVAGEKWQRAQSALDAVGGFRSGHPDIGVEHDSYLFGEDL
jgi:hypothetical protein